MPRIEEFLGQGPDGIEVFYTYDDQTLEVVRVRAENPSGRTFDIIAQRPGQEATRIHIGAGASLSRAVPNGAMVMVRSDPQGDPQALAFDGAFYIASTSTTAAANNGPKLK